MIVRGKRSENFTVLSNALLEDPNIDWRDLGLLVYLLSKPDHWTVSPSHLSRVRKAGRDAIYASLKRLRETGYVVMKKHGTGKLDYVVYDAPQTSDDIDDPDPENTDEDNPDPDNPDPDNPDPEIPTLVRTDNTTSTEKRETRARDFVAPTKKQVDDFAATESLNLTSYFEVRSQHNWHTVNGKPIDEWQVDARVWASRPYSITRTSEDAGRPAPPLYKAEKVEPLSEKSKQIGRDALAGLNIRRRKT